MHKSTQGKISSSARLSGRTISNFRRTIYRNYERNGRTFSWRATSDPYAILVSEFMLQQTQTERVIAKFDQFLERFPDFQALAEAPLRDVFEVWQGLGYNRRARMLRDTARIVVAEHAGKLPSDVSALRRLPGIGPATASAIAAFAFNQPALLLETNIRRVFIHFFFPEQEGVKDKEILPLIEAALDRSDPRRWYYALMDYGVMLKKSGPNANRRSAHYQKQAPFKGSNRELRGAIIKALTKRRMTRAALSQILGADTEKLERPLTQLIDEGFIRMMGNRLALAE